MAYQWCKAQDYASVHFPRPYRKKAVISVHVDELQGPVKGKRRPEQIHDRKPGSRIHACQGQEDDDAAKDEEKDDQEGKSAALEEGGKQKGQCDLQVAYFRIGGVQVPPS